MCSRYYQLSNVFYRTQISLIDHEKYYFLCLPVTKFGDTTFMLHTRLSDRVFSGLEHLEMSGNFDASRKSQEIFETTRKSGKVTEFCCVKFIFSQSEHTDFKNFLGACPQISLIVLDRHKNLILVWKSQGISSFLDTGHPGVSYLKLS